MSPNGLRRWRAYAKKCRYRSRKEGKCSNDTGKTTRKRFPRRQVTEHWMRGTPLPSKPFSPRSLVGMTMGARKRAWLSGALSAYLFPHRDSTGGEYDTRSDYSWSEIRVDAPYLGTKLGERIRPCPGCMECDPKGFASMCDGSGVLPARQA